MVLFEAPLTPSQRWKGSLALVPVGKGCPRCGAPSLHIERSWQPALFRHGGYGATQQHTHAICLKCFWSVTRETIEINPRKDCNGS